MLLIVEQNSRLLARIVIYFFVKPHSLIQEKHKAHHIAYNNLAIKLVRVIPSYKTYKANIDLPIHQSWGNPGGCKDRAFALNFAGIPLRGVKPPIFGRRVKCLIYSYLVPRSTKRLCELSLPLLITYKCITMPFLSLNNFNVCEIISHTAEISTFKSRYYFLFFRTNYE